MLRPLTFDIEKQESEIEDAQVIFDKEIFQYKRSCHLSSLLQIQFRFHAFWPNYANVYS